MTQTYTPTEPEEYAIEKAKSEMLRFLIEDNAFSTDFLITTIEEYVSNNSEKTHLERTKTQKTTIKNLLDDNKGV